MYLGGIWEETTAGAVKQYYSLHGATVAVRDSVTGVAYLHADHLGSVSVASGAGAALLSRQAFGPWGTVTSGGVSQTALNFTGQRLDSGTGLLYYHARLYDPALARYVSPDTRAPDPSNPQDLNLYSYVHNNPVRYNDPSGHCIPYIGDCRPVWETGQGLNVTDFQQYSAGVVEGMGSLGAGVANAITGETVQTAARGLEVLISDPGGAAATIGQAALDQGKALMQTAAAVASDPAGAAAHLNDNPRALERILGQAAGDLALAKIAKDAGGEGGGCGLNSFAPDTPVLTADGPQAIGTLEIGDDVLAYDQASGRLGRFPITQVWVHRDAVLVDLRIDQTLIETTPEHPFFTAEAGWVAAGALWAGAHIRTAAGTAGVVQQLAVVARTQVMYNLTVATAHTFFVGDAGWLVHNACPKAILKKLREPGTFNPTAPSKQDALEWAQEAFPNAVHLPDAQPNAPYPSTSGYNKWYRFEPAEPSVGNDLPHIKYADWTGGKKGRGGSWGHIFYPEE